MGEPNDRRGDNDAEVIGTVANDMDENTHHGKISVWFVNCILGIDVMLVVDVLRAYTNRWGVG